MDEGARSERLARRRRRRRDERIAAVGVSAWGAALVAVNGGELLVCVVATLVVVVGGVVTSISPHQLTDRGSHGRWALMAVAGVAALAVALPVVMAADDRNELRSAASGRAITAVGVVASKVEPTQRGDLRFDLEVRHVTARELDEPLRVVVTVSVDPGAVDGGVLDLGSSVLVRGTAQSADAGERSVLEIAAVQGVEVHAPPPGILRATAELRQGFVELSSQLPGAGGELLPGLAVGDTSALTNDLDEAMKDSSLSHLTAVSGANCAIIVGLVFALAGALRAPRWGRILVALLALGGFVALVTPEPSVVRAAVMATIALAALAWDRRGTGVAVLSFAIVVLLASDPWLSTQLGFALSAAATAALLIVAPRIAAGMERWMPTPLALALAVPLAAQLACGPLLVLIEPEIPIFGVVANLVAGPAAPVATVVGLAACMTAAIPGLGIGLAWIAWLPSSWIAATAHTFARLPGAQISWTEGAPGALALAALGLAIAIALTRPPAHRMARAARFLSLWVVALTGAVAAGGIALAGVLAPLTVPPDWVVAQCDVGQGDAVVLRSGDEIMVIDTGPEPQPFATCLTTLGVERVDVLVLTHFDLDHVGGVGILGGRVDHVVHGPFGEEADERLIAGLVAAGATAHEGRAGSTGEWGTARWRILWPKTGAAGFTPGNDTSLVLDVSGDDRMPRGLYLGDLSADAQRAVLSTGTVRGPFDVVKFAHHGSADQLPAMYDTAAASIALIGVGADNTFGHPREEALALVPDAVVVRSDVDGIGVIRIVDGSLRVWRANG